MRPRLLDLFCGAGGGAMGYHRAGFDVVGVDIRPQPNYPFDFVQADAFGHTRNWLDAFEIIETSGWDFDAIHASPPCQAFSSLRTLRRDLNHPDLVAPTRGLLDETGLPYVIENVVGAPLNPTVVLCGSMFGLGVRRHRLFEATFPMLQYECQHGLQGVPLGVYGHPRGGESSNRKNKGKKGSTDEWVDAMGIDWMSARELAQAIPPAYTELIGHQLLQHLRVAA